MNNLNTAALTDEQWIERCAKRFMERGGLDAKTAREFADACLEMRIDAEMPPEDAADEDMSYWTDDGE